MRNVKQDLANLSQKTVKDIKMGRLMKFAKDAERQRELEASYGDELKLNIPNIERVKHLVAQVLKNEADEVNGDLPVVSVFDAFQHVKAQKDLNKDAGLRALCGQLQMMWGKSLDDKGPADITAASFMRLRDHYARNYPRSKAASVIDGFGKKGYATLNRSDLLRIASEIETQEDFEKAVIDNGLQGGAPNQVKARKFILACVNFQEREACRSFDRRAQGSPDGDFDDEILDGMARALYVDAWASGMDEEGLTGNWGGMDLMDLAGETSPYAYEKAKNIYKEIEQLNDTDLSKFTPPGEKYDTYDRENFGHYLIMEALGSGVSWFDDHEDHGLKLPRIEYYPWDDDQVMREIEEAKQERGVEEDFDKESRRAQVTEDEKYKTINEMRQALSDVDLYYAAEVAAREIPYILEEAEDLDEWVMIQGFKDGMSHIDESNMEMVLNDLNEGDPENIKRVQGGEYAVRALDENGDLTKAGEILTEIITALSDYPVLDDFDLSQREHDETIENIRSEGWSLVDEDVAPDDWSSAVFSWLWENNQESLDYTTDTGGSYPSRDAIKQALSDLGWLYEEE